MNYEIKLYAHGVPKGQSTWGIESSDSNYIDIFYGRKSNVHAQMFVEVRQFGSYPYSYYTYLRAGNVCDKEGRAGSYFALTLRINYYYADVRNIYNLLDAAFNKFIVGSILTVNSGVARYLITDLYQADTTLKALEQEINKYLMQFSSDSDFISLNGFRTNGQNEPAAINILECDPKILVNYVKTNGSISVSHLHPTTREQEVIKRMQSEVDAAKSQAQRQISEAQQNANRSIQEAQRDKEDGIRAIRDEYREADKTISSLRHSIEKANKEIAHLKENTNKLNQQLQKAESYKEEYANAKKELDKQNVLIAKIRENLSGLSGISELLGLKTFPLDGNATKSKTEKEDSTLLMGLVRKIHPLLDFFVIIILLGIIGVTLPRSCDSKELSSTQFAESNLPQQEIEATINGDNEDGIPNNGETLSTPSLKELYPDAKIDIAEVSKTKPMRFGDGSSYTLSLKNADNGMEARGNWVSNDFAIYENQVTPKKKGPCSVSFVIGNDTLVSRTINVN